MVWWVLASVGASGALPAGKASFAEKVNCQLFIPHVPPIPLEPSSDASVRSFSATLLIREAPGGGRVEVETFKSEEVAFAMARVIAHILGPNEPPNHGGGLGAFLVRQRRAEAIEKVERIFQKIEVRLYPVGPEITPDTGIRLLLTDSLHWASDQPSQEWNQTVSDGTAALFHLPYLKNDGGQGYVPGDLECAVKR